MKTALSLAPCLCFVLAIACGDSGSGGSGGDGSGNGPSTGGNGSGGNGAGNTGGGPTVGGNGSGGSGPTEPCPSEVSNIPQDECDFYLQDCPNGGTCDIGGTPTAPVATCFEQDGLKGIGDTCGNPAECEAHLTCVGNKCSPFCCPRHPDSCGGGVCSIDVHLQDENGEDTIFLFKACSFAPTCDLFLPESCETPGESCYLAGKGQTGCAQTGELMDGEACFYSNDCVTGQACIGPENEAFCHFLCEDGSEAQPPGMGGCPGGQTCNLNLTSGFDGLGFCE